MNFFQGTVYLLLIVTTMTMNFMNDQEMHFRVAADILPTYSLSTFDLSGPGCSSIGGGAFTELGPFYPRGDGRGLRLNKKSWNKG